MIKNLYNLYGIDMRVLGYKRGIAGFIESLKMDCQLGSKILDIGCGTGITGLALLKKVKGSTLLATDLDERFLRKIIAKAKKEKIEESRITVGGSDINFPDKVALINGPSICLERESFDIISSGAVIGYSKDQEKTIKKILSLIKLKGYFINLEMN